MIQSLKGPLAHHKFLSALVNLCQMKNEIFSVQFMDLKKSYQVVNQLRYTASIPLGVVFKSNAVS